MKIYRLRFLIDSYQMLEQEFDEDDTEQFKTVKYERLRSLSRCQPFDGLLTPPDVFSSRPKMEQPDLWFFAPRRAIAVSTVNLGRLQPFLEEAGQLLPLSYKSEVFSVLNVLKCVNYEIFPEKTPGRLHQEMAAKNIPSGIFRSVDRTYFYVSETTGDPANEFKAFVEQEGMTGLGFLEVWNSAL